MKPSPGASRKVLKLQTEESLSRNVMVDIPIPTPATLKQWQRTVADFDAKNYEKSLDGTLDKLDRIVAKAFKIPAGEVEFIKSEFQNDPMLRRVRPNLPFTDRRLLASARISPRRTDTRRHTRRGVRVSSRAGVLAHWPLTSRQTTSPRLLRQ